MTDQTEPVRKSLLPCTPPPEREFHTVYGARTGTDGCALFPGDTGPVVIRRRVTYGDWEPVRPDRWADEPPTDSAAAGVAPAADQTAEQQAEPRTTWTPGPVAVAQAAEWARQAGKAAATIEALTANAGCSEHPNAGSIGPYCLACTIVPPQAASHAAEAEALWDELHRRDTEMDQPHTPAADQTGLRDRIAAAIRQAACTGNCGKPEDECAKERIQPFAWHHGRLAIVEATPEQIADAVMSVLPDQQAAIRAAALREAADRLAELRAAEREWLPATGLHEGEQELRRMAAGAQQQDGTEAPHSTAPLAAGLPLVRGNCPACGHASLFLGSGGYVTCSTAECREPDAASTVLEQYANEAHPPEHTWKVESPRRDQWASWGTTYDEPDWARESYEHATKNAPKRPFRLVRATTTYTVEAEYTPPALVAEQPAAGGEEETQA